MNVTQPPKFHDICLLAITTFFNWIEMSNLSFKRLVRYFCCFIKVKESRDENANFCKQID